MENSKSDTAHFVVRERYLSAIEAFIDQPVVKVLKGMRRVGKSVIMRLLIDRLINRGIPGANILYINKESLAFDAIKDYRDLYRYAGDYFTGGPPGRKYILIDEIQDIVGWERAVASFLADGMGDIIISGSNAGLLSSELATLISGRYVEIPVYPLTFREFLTFRKNKGDTKDNADQTASPQPKTETDNLPNAEAEFKNYLRYGGVPGIHHWNDPRYNTPQKLDG